MTELQFFIPGIPRPGGSKTPKLVRRGSGEIVMKNGRPLITMRDDAKGNKDWRAVCSTAGHDAMRACGIASLLSGPLSLSIDFVMPRPRSHFGTGRNAGRLKLPAPHWHTVKPDRTKLTRALEDALTGIIWRDDTQVVTGPINKHYGEQPGALVRVKELT